MLQKLLFIFLLIIASNNSSYAQSFCDTSFTEEMNIHPIRELDDSANILLYEVDTFKLFSTFDFLINNLQGQIEKYHVEWDSDLLLTLRDSTIKLEERIRNIHKSRILNNRLDLRILDLIRDDKCWIYNKVSNSFEQKLIITKYVKNCTTGIIFSNTYGQTIFDVTTGAF